MLSKNDIITLEIVDLTAEAMGVGRHEGMAVFVPMSSCRGQAQRPDRQGAEKSLLWHH